MKMISTRAWQNYIDGEWCDGSTGEHIEVVNPVTGHVFAQVARAMPQDIDRAVAAARRSFERRDMLSLTPAERGRLMFDVARHLREMTDEIAELECQDNGRSLEGGRNEVALTARYLEYYGGMADKLEGRQIPLGDGIVDFTVHMPFGVSAQIVPWNGPLPVGARSVCCALITGNTVVLKSPEDAPMGLIKFAQACERAGVPRGAFNLVCGLGHDAGAALAAHPGVDHIVFTGSVETGRRVLQAAAQRVVPCVMELGGKSAAIVHADADLPLAAQRVARGIFTNAGQICSAASRVLVHRSVHGAFVEAMVREALARRPGSEAGIGPLNSARQLAKVEGLCQVGEEEGARLACGGRRAKGMQGYFMEPTVFEGVTPSMRVAQEEFFGPVVVVMPFDSPQDAVDIANGTEYGLAAGVFTRDISLALWTADRLVAGQVYVNDWWVGGVETPFGGTKRSGYGREKGQEALLGYVQTKNIGIRL